MQERKKQNGGGFFITSDLSHLLLISVLKENKLGRAVACMV